MEVEETEACFPLIAVFLYGLDFALLFLPFFQPPCWRFISGGSSCLKKSQEGGKTYLQADTNLNPFFFTQLFQIVYVNLSQNFYIKDDLRGVGSIGSVRWQIARDFFSNVVTPFIKEMGF